MTARAPPGPLVWRAGLHAAGLAAALWVAWRGAPVLKLLAIAAVLAAALETPVAALSRRGWRRGWAIAAVLAGALALLGGLASAVAPAVVSQAAALVDGLPDVAGQVQESDAVRWADRRFEVIERASEAVRRHLSTIAGSVVAAATGVATFAAGVVTVFALTGFLLGSAPPLWRQALRWMEPAERARRDAVARKVRSAVAGYVAGALVVGSIAGLVTGVTTALLGVPYFVPLAAATAVLGVVPFVGAIVSAALVTAVTFVAAGWKAGLVALGVFLVYQQLEGAVLQPLIQRRAVALNPLVVIVAALLGTAAGGAFGGVMAVPLAAALQVILGEALAERERGRARGGPSARGRDRPEGEPGRAASP